MNKALKVRVGGRYRHYKGHEYEVVGIALHSETKEEMVVYRRVDADEPHLWVRPKAMFLETVVVGGKKVRRFKLIKEPKPAKSMPKMSSAVRKALVRQYNKEQRQHIKDLAERFRIEKEIEDRF